MASTVTYDEIVTERTRPTLVLAGPGAGKTHLLGDRVKRLLDSGVKHSEITVLTFGTDAARNIRDKLLDPHSPFAIKPDQLPRASTLHALGNEIVNSCPSVVHLRKANLRVQPDEAVAKTLFRDAALLAGLAADDAAAARKCKARGECKPDASTNGCRVCQAYWHVMSKCNCIDYDDQVLFAIRVFQEDKTLLEKYQQECRHLLVDEYQDINAAQFTLIDLLSRQSPDGLFVVGDDAQSIYGFRGATPDYILGFESTHGRAWSAPLACSRRCPESILRPAQVVLAKYYPHWSGPQEVEYLAPPGDEPEVWQVPSEDAEARCVARIARRAVDDHRTVLVLAPKKAFFSRLSRALGRHGVPHDCQVDLLPNATSDRLSVVWKLMEWVQDPDDNFLARTAIECIINCGETKVPGAAKGSRIRPETIATRNRVEAEVACLWNDVSNSCSLMGALEKAPSPSKELTAGRDSLRAIRASYADSEGEMKGEFAKRLALACGGWVEPQKLARDLLSMKQEILGGQPPGFSSVQLMTLRKAKGLEADVVVMVGLEDDIVPGSSPDVDVEEQARLFYVGMSRAKRALYLIHSFKRPRDVSFGKDVMKKQRSRFLEAMGLPSKYRSEHARGA